MAAQREWERLSASTRKRYISKGRALGQDEAAVRAYYLSGGNMSAYRGHASHYGLSERQWSTLRKAARDSELATTPRDITTILESLLAKGFTYDWILGELRRQQSARRTFRSGIAKWLRQQGNDLGWQPGRRRYHRRPALSDIELFYYH